MIADRLTEVRARIAAAARSVGRDPLAVRLIAVSKTIPLDRIREAYVAGQRDFGENRVQEALQKIQASTDFLISWHLLGHLQTNKARKRPCLRHDSVRDDVDCCRSSMRGSGAGAAPNC